MYNPYDSEHNNTNFDSEKNNNSEPANNNTTPSGNTESTYTPPVYGQTTNAGTPTDGTYSYPTNTTDSYMSNQNPSGSYHSTGSSYTWTTGESLQAPQQQHYYTHTPQPKQKKAKKRSGKHPFVKGAAVILCCLITSAATLGAFVGLIQNGTIAIDGGAVSADTKPAFTINKIIEDDITTTTPMGEGVKTLTKQEIAEKVIPSVVCLQVYTETTSYNNFFSYFQNGGIPNDGNQQGETTPELTSQGSGVISTEDGYVITNAHVVANASKIQVVTSDGTSYEAELVGADSVTDLAVIKIQANGTKFTPATFGSAEDLHVADEVMAVGNPGGLELSSTVTMGYISALDREVTDSSTGYSMNCIQTDAAISPGNSGGALVNMYGQVIGINSSKIAASGYEGLGFAIPTDTVQPIVSNLIEYGYVKDRAMLGITLSYIDEMTAEFYHFKPGLYVHQLNSQEAQACGLQISDIITAIDGMEVNSTEHVSAYLLDKKPGETVKLSVYRAASNQTLEIDLVLTQNTETE